jgi:hypothetical protein
VPDVDNPKDCSNCQITAVVTAPGTTSRTGSRRAGAKRDAKMAMALLMTTDAASVRDLPAVPSVPAPPPAAIDKAVVPWLRQAPRSIHPPRGAYSAGILAPGRRCDAEAGTGPGLGVRY